MLQYIPTKAAKFGIKLWMLVESVTCYMFHTIVYRGRRYDPTLAGTTQGFHVVKNFASILKLNWKILSRSM